MAGHERRLHHRGARPGRSLAVEWRVTGGAWATTDTGDIGVGGAFLRRVIAAVGTHVELRLPGDRGPLTLAAVVRWASPAGVGVQFLDVDIDVLLELNQLLAAPP